jgi:hypothetical protein
MLGFSFSNWAIIFCVDSSGGNHVQNLMVTGAATVLGAATEGAGVEPAVVEPVVVFGVGVVALALQPDATSARTPIKDRNLVRIIILSSECRYLYD